MILFLEGTVLRKVQQMPVERCGSCVQIVNRLSKAFKPSTTESHRILIGIKLRLGDSVESLFYDSVMLWKASTGISEEISNELMHRIVLPFFLEALPESISAKLRLKGGSLLDIDQLIIDSRSLVKIEDESRQVVGAIGRGKDRKQGDKKNGVKRRPQSVSDVEILVIWCHNAHTLPMYAILVNNKYICLKSVAKGIRQFR